MDGINLVQRHDDSFRAETMPLPKKRRRVKEENSDILGNSLDTMELDNFAANSKDPLDAVVRDEFSIFGEYVATTIRNLNDKKIQSWVRNQISNALYSAESLLYE